MKAIKYIMTILGAGILVGAVFAYNATNELHKKSITAQGTVIGLLESRSDGYSTTNNVTVYSPFIEFTEQGGTQVQFTSSTRSYPPKYEVGETVEIIYDPESPKDAYIKGGFFSNWIGVIILVIFGVILFAIGVMGIVFTIQERNRIKHLKRNGRRIESNFQSAEPSRSYPVNGKTPYKIVSNWENPATSQLHVFTTDEIWFNPTSYIKTDKIIVLMNNNNHKDYLIDLSFLPEIKS